MSNYLDYLAQLNKPYLHVKGEVATEHLINWLDCQPEERILDFGLSSLIGSFYGKLFLIQTNRLFKNSFKLFASEQEIMEGYLSMALNSKPSA